MKPQEAFEYFGFKRTTRFNKEHLPAKLRKDWLSKDKKYRIYWRRQFRGVTLLGCYYALKYVHVNHPNGGWFMWDFAYEHKPYKTLSAAVTACMRAEKLEVDEKIKPKRRRRRKQKVTIMANEPAQQIPFAYTSIETIPTTQPTKRRGRPPGSKNTKPRSDKGKSRGPRKGKS